MIRSSGASLACMLHVACAGGAQDLEVAPAPRPPASVAASSSPSPSDGPSDAGATATTDAGPLGYERMLTRPHATFGLAEARGIEPERLGQVLESIANGFEGCAQNAQAQGWLERAALRLVVQVDGHGQVVGVDTKLDDPARGGKIALLCLVAPVRSLNFGEAPGNTRRGLALEVLFGPVQSR